MLAVAVTITRYVSDEPVPGIVECELLDANGNRWRFIEKTAVVSASELSVETLFPQLGVIAGEVVGSRRDRAGREVIRFDTQHPWGVESVDGVTQFDVLRESLIEL
jgi:hypothetical protein